VFIQFTDQLFLLKWLFGSKLPAQARKQDYYCKQASMRWVL